MPRGIDGGVGGSKTTRGRCRPGEECEARADGPSEDCDNYDSASIAIATRCAVASPQNRKQSNSHSNDEHVSSQLTRQICRTGQVAEWQGWVDDMNARGCLVDSADDGERDVAWELPPPPMLKEGGEIDGGTRDSRSRPSAPLNIEGAAQQERPFLR